MIQETTMKNLLLNKRARLLAAICTLICTAALTALIVSNRAAAQPTTFLSPLQQPAPFLSVPYYGAEYLTAYVDHDPLGGGRNSSILIFDGRTASLANGWCDDADYNPHIAFWTSPNPPHQCLWYDAHHGNDFDLDYEPVLASADGTVIRAGWDNWADRTAGYGLHLRISHDGDYETRYGHLSALAVITNALVTRDQIIGTSGNTGDSTGSHLHFEVRLNGTPTDPFGGSGSHWLWQDGSWSDDQWVGQPEPNYGTPLVVDDDSPYFAKGRGGLGGVSCPPENCPYWYRVTTTGWDGDMLYTYMLGSTTDYWARWSPPRYGLYEVQVWIPNNHATAYEARYWLVSSWNYMPSTYGVIDQYGVSNRWISLGVHEFGDFPHAPWVGLWMSDREANPGEHNRKFGVDAIRFRAPWPVYIPLVLKNY
jgi:murein DD-endopeptidase MepM/ murein hydrolase activator NlpD